MAIKGKKTWFDKESQKWVSEMPDEFWTGYVDCYTGEKLFSKDKFYRYDRGKWHKVGGLDNPHSWASFYEEYPYYHDYNLGYRYTKNPYNK